MSYSPELRDRRHSLLTIPSCTHHFQIVISSLVCPPCVDPVHQEGPTAYHTEDDTHPRVYQEGPHCIPHRGRQPPQGSHGSFSCTSSHTVDSATVTAARRRDSPHHTEDNVLGLCPTNAEPSNSLASATSCHSGKRPCKGSSRTHLRLCQAPFPGSECVNFSKET